MSKIDLFKLSDEIIIEILNEPGATDDADGEKPRGAHGKKGFGTAPEFDAAGRRRLKTKSIMNFWDVSLKKNDSGSFDETATIWKPGYHENPDFPGFVDGLKDMRLTDYNDLKTRLLSVDVSEWETKFKKIEFETAERYGFDIIADNELLPVARPGSRNKIFSGDAITETVWKETGLSYSGKIENNFTCVSYLGFNYFETADTSKYKVTELNHFDAPAVEFTPKGELKIFLLPRVVAGYSDTLKNIGGSPPLLKFTNVYWNYFVLRRAFFLQTAFFGARVPLSGYMPEPFTNDQKLAILDELAGGGRDENALAQIAYGYNSTPHPTPPPPEQSNGVGFPDGATFFNLSESRATYIAGQLLAAIKNADKIFYIWSNNGQQSFSPNISFIYSAF